MPFARTTQERSHRAAVLPRSGAPLRTIVAATLPALLVAGCTSSGHRASSSSSSPSSTTAGTVAAAPPSTTARSGAGRVALDGLTVATAGSSATLTAQPAELPAAGQAQLSYFAKRFGSHVAALIQLHTDSALPAGGAVLSRTYPTPLPKTVTATFMYFDTSIGGWRTVASTLSPNRRTVTARVHHFSAWTTVTTPVGGWVQGVGNGVTWFLGSMFDTRVAAPTCDGKVPAWVENSVFLDGLNTPLRWCVGHDPNHSDWLVVKVPMNRGYGATVQTSTNPAWSWNSFLGRSGVSVTAHLLTDYSAEAGKYASVLLQPGAQVIPGGEEVDFGFTESQVRNAAGQGVSLVSVSQPTLIDLAMDLIIQQMADQISNKQLAYLVGVLTILQCGGDIVRAGVNPAALAGAVSGCVADAQDIIAHELVNRALKDLKMNPAEAAKAAVDASKKLILITAAGVTFQLVSDIEDLHLDSAARAASVFLDAPVALCAVPHCSRVATVDIDGDGRPDQVALAVVSHTPGGEYSSDTTTWTLRVLTATGDLAVVRYGPQMLYGQDVFFAAPAFDGAAGHEIVLRMSPGVHTQWFQIYTWRNGKLARENNPNGTPSYQDAGWAIDQALSEVVGITCGSAGGHATITQTLLSPSAAPGTEPRVFTGTTETWAWLAGLWLRTTKRATSIRDDAPGFPTLGRWHCRGMPSG
jgi:hypothetical protein